MLRLLFATIGFVVCLTGCMSAVRTNVEAYSALPEDVDSKKVYIAAFEGQNTSSLQYKTNARILANELSEKGLQVVSKRRDADLIAFIGYAVDSGEVVTTQYSIPQFGVTGYSGSTTYGTVYGNTLTANTYYTPTYGVTGYSTGTSSEVVYTRSFAINIVDPRSNEIQYEARAVSRGSCGSFTGVADEIIGATLKEFPKGSVGSVDMPFDGSC